MIKATATVTSAVTCERVTYKTHLRPVLVIKSLRRT